MYSVSADFHRQIHCVDLVREEYYVLGKCRNGASCNILKVRMVEKAVSTKSFFTILGGHLPTWWYCGKTGRVYLSKTRWEYN